MTPKAFSCSPCTLWPASTVPQTPDEADTNSTELGTKFKSDVNGLITGVRFYKAKLNTGTHIGNLWTLNGTKLASATFTNETTSGWQQVNFATPVSISAGTVYVVSYFAPAGHYAGDGGYFATSLDNPPLHAPQDGLYGGNGVYRYGSTSGFPNSTYDSESYYVDVVFTTPTGPTAPAAPTSVTATAGDKQATVSWTAPSDGGSAITSYTVTPYAGTTAQTPTTVTGSPPATTTTVTGLTDGTAYTFKVSATNAIGTGPDSAASNTVTPTGPTAPAAPTSVTATAGDKQATVSWTAPSDGGSAITSYTVTPYAGTTAQTPTTVTGSPPATTTTVTGLTDGTAYTFKVSATNAIGTGPDSAASNTVTPTGPTAPAAPTSVTATAGDKQATVSWTAPSDGGSAITSYTVTPYAGTTAQTPTTVTGSPPATTTTVTGLTDGTTYTFTVSATNAIGTGPASTASNTVTPTAAPTAPAAPTGVTRHRRRQAGHRELDRALQRRQRDHELHRHPVRRHHRPDAHDGHRQPARDDHDRHRPDRRHRLHLHGHGHQRRRHRPGSTASNAVTPAAGNACTTCTIWPVMPARPTPSNDDNSGVELGVKFTSDVNGQITGIRFYKGTGNTGTHVGNLWTTSGTKLATVTFTSESSTGWQQANFADPGLHHRRHRLRRLLLRAGGHYAGDSDAFATAGVDNPPLHALKDGVSGGNGVYAYGAGSTLPDEQLPVHQLLGRRRLLRKPHGTGCANRRERHRRGQAGHSHLDGTAQRRQPHLGLHHHALHRHHRSDRHHRHRQPAGYDGDGHGAD